MTSRTSAFMLPDILTAVKEGQIFAGLHGELQIEYYMRRNPDTAICVALEPSARHPGDISIAERTDAPNLLQWVNVCLANHAGLLDSTEIVQRYLKAPVESRQAGEAGNRRHQGCVCGCAMFGGNHAAVLTS